MNGGRDGESTTEGRGARTGAAPIASSEGRLRLLSELAHEFAYSLTALQDGMFRVDWTTPNLESVLGLHVGMHVPADTWKRLVYPEDHAATLEWMQLLTSGGAAPLEHRVASPKGDVVWVHHFARVTPLGDRHRIDGVALDITERKLAEQSLEQSEERFRAIADHVSDLLVEINSRGRVVYVNEALRDLLGYDPALWMGARVSDSAELRLLVHRDDVDRVEERLRSGIADGVERAGRNRVRHMDGSWRWMEFVARSYPTADGLHRLLLARDVTDQVHREEASREYAERLELEVRRRTEDLERANAQLRQLQSRVLHAETLGAADEITGSLAHAINNPLGALLGRVQMELESPQPTREGLHRIHGLAQRIQSVVSNTLTLFREGRLRLQRESASDLLEELRSELSDRIRTSGVELRTMVDPDLPPVLIDRGLLLSALVSLAENGIEAMPDGGTLELEAVQLRDIEVVQFRVGDHGCGIPVDLVPHIFDPFFTTKPEGTGLGLTIANGIVRGHGGRISVHRRVTGGTQFQVNLPYAGRPRFGARPGAH